MSRNASGRGKIRMDGIDALETHYRGVGPEDIGQPGELAAEARKELLKWLGFTDVVISEEGADKGRVTACTPETVPGFILASGADAFGRCIALVGRGRPPAHTQSGDLITVTTDLLHQTANHHLLDRGLVYPTFYSKLPRELRVCMSETVRRARGDSPPRGVWAKDVTFSETGVTIESLASITEQQVILPRLFRRLSDYVRVFGPSLSCFRAYLAGEMEEFLLPCRDEPLKGFQNVLHISGGTVRMTERIEDVVFVER
ncbi:nuclease [Streptomyces bambusae]|uniref:nuclease n=1 Tax=Streptomyces bambusae TaxID=1550616 RepID=UPI001CFFE6F7|nr:nuclease [Streptomyces bambusae]MCB5169501.1 nuclease [Streptomyces bambusae]